LRARGDFPLCLTAASALVALAKIPVFLSICYAALFGIALFLLTMEV